MKNFFRIFLIIFILFTLNLNSQGFENLSKKAGNSIKDYFSSKQQKSFSIISIENYSNLNDIETQQLYQLLVSCFENKKGLNFKDNFLSFNNKKGVFNTYRIKELDFLITLKLINNRGKTGIGIIIFSRKFDRIVSIKYFEEKIGKKEKFLLKHFNYPFKKTGFFKSYEMKVFGNLLDVISLNIKTAEKKRLNLVFFFYLKKISIFKFEVNSLVKIFDIPLEWGRPFYPVFEYEGKASYFEFDGKIYVTIGSNFSDKTKIFYIDPSSLKLINYGSSKIVPISKVNINGEPKILGVKYETGKNYFKKNIYIMNLVTDDFNKNEMYEKEMINFFSISIQKNNNELNGIVLVDLNYKMKIYSGVFKELYTSKNKYGYSSTSFSNGWIVLSSFSRGSDSFNFFKIKNSIELPLYTNKTSGEIVFISEGVFSNKNGIWVKIKENEHMDFRNIKLQFWSKNVK